MSEEIERVLMILVDKSYSQDQSGVSVGYLSKRLDIEHQPLLKIIEMLEQAGYVQVQQFGRVKLVAPTLQGYEKAAVWQKDEREKSWLKRIPTLLKVISGSLLAALLGLLWWWLGLSPQTSSLQPASASIPIKVYQVDISPPTEPIPAGSWFHFPNAPQPGQAIYFESYDEYNELLLELLPDYIPVTFDGWVHFHLDVESVATRYQVNIDAILVQIEFSPIDSLEDIYYFTPALGGGVVRKYELDLSAQPTYSTQEGIQIYEAVLKSDGEAVDYIFLKPGERESIEIAINLGTPGNYVLTPIINYAFREESSSLQTNSYHVVYPQRYRTWFRDQNPISTSGGVRTGGDGFIKAYDIVVDTQSGHIQISDRPVQAASSCLPSVRWIAFESSMVTYGYMNRLFLISTNGNSLGMIGARDLHGVRRYLEWTDNNKLLIGEPVWDEALSKYVHEVKSVDPSGGRADIVASDTLPAAELWYDDAWNDICLEPGQGCLITRSFDDTNGDGRIDNQDARQIYLDQNGVLTRLGFSGEDQAYLSLSPDEMSIAFVQGEGLGATCRYDDVQNVYVMRTDGSELRQVTDTFGWYRNPVWSSDGRYLAFESARLPDNGGELHCFESIYHIYVVDLETGNEIQLTSGSLSDHGPQWSADGQWVLAGGERLSLSRWDGSCSQDVFVPPVGNISNVLMQP